MSGDTGPDLTDSRLAEVTAFVDIEAPPPTGRPAAVLIFGTNQTEPAVIAAGRYRQGLAPLIIATGGVNRHNQVTEARGVPFGSGDSACLDRAKEIPPCVRREYQGRPVRVLAVAHDRAMVKPCHLHAVILLTRIA
jgi:hypothetical protein